MANGSTYRVFAADPNNWLDLTILWHALRCEDIRGMCPFPDCEEQETLVICPTCLHIGHPLALKSVTPDCERITIRHAHFTTNNAIGRNLMCPQKQPMFVPEEYRIPTWRLQPSKMPDYIRSLFG
jgi:hypothetical protein